jgi:hypothetical protein
MSTTQRVRQKTRRPGFAAMDLVILVLVILSLTAVAAFADETGQWAHCPGGTALVGHGIVPNEEIPDLEVAICSVDGYQYIVTTDLNIFDGILLDENFMQDVFVAALGVIQGKGLIPRSMDFTDRTSRAARRLRPRRHHRRRRADRLGEGLPRQHRLLGRRADRPSAGEASRDRGGSKQRKRPARSCSAWHIPFFLF